MRHSVSKNRVEREIKENIGHTHTHTHCTEVGRTAEHGIKAQTVTLNATEEGSLFHFVLLDNRHAAIWSIKAILHT